MKRKWLVMVALVSAAGCGQAAPTPSSQAVAGSASTRVASTAKYAADVPSSILTPDTVQTPCRHAEVL